MMDKNEKVIRFSMIVLIGFLLSAIMHYVLGAYLGKGYPLNTFLFRPWNRFADFFNPLRALSEFKNPYSYYEQTNILIPYLPFTFLVLLPFSFMPKMVAILIYLAFFSISLLVIAKKYVVDGFEDMPSKMIFSLTAIFLAYPSLSAVDRANIEIIVFIFIALFFYFFEKDSVLSAVFLGAAIAMKLYPGVLMFLFVSKKDHKKFLICGIAAIVFMFFGYFSISLFSGDRILDIARMNLSQMGLHKPTYAYSIEGLQHNHTLWGFILGLDVFSQMSVGNRLFSLDAASRIYVVFVMLAFACAVVYVILSKDHVWRKAAVLISAMLVFPYTSFDYSLIHVFFIMILFIRSKQERTRAESWYYLLLIAIPLIPVDYFYLVQDASISIIVYPLALSTLSLSIMVSWLSSLRKGRRSAPLVSQPS